MRIFEHNFSDNKEKGRRHTVVCQVLLTQLAGKFAKKTCVAKILNRLLAYLENLDVTMLRPTNRIDDLCQYIEKHRNHIPTYALRAELGLRNSSNRVEKANDLVVAQRQKHNGMSWSTSGSGALAQITALIINNELCSWLNEGILPEFHSIAA